MSGGAYIYLDDNGAKAVLVRVNEDRELEIDDFVFSEAEALKMAQFIQENFGG